MARVVGITNPESLIKAELLDGASALISSPLRLNVRRFSFLKFGRRRRIFLIQLWQLPGKLMRIAFCFRAQLGALDHGLQDFQGI